MRACGDTLMDFAIFSMVDNEGELLPSHRLYTDRRDIPLALLSSRYVISISLRIRCRLFAKTNVMSDFSSVLDMAHLSVALQCQ